MLKNVPINDRDEKVGIPLASPSASLLFSILGK